MRSHDRPGAVSVPNHNVDAQQSHNHLQYFSQPTAKPNMVVEIKKVGVPQQKVPLDR